MKIQSVRKSNGHIQKFSEAKLERSIFAALTHARHAKHEPAAEKMTHHIATLVTAELTKEKGGIVSTKEIEQVTIQTLRNEKQHETAESYALSTFDLRSLPVPSVQKRNGNTEPFNARKLFKSIRKSFEDAGAGIESGPHAEELTREVIGRIVAEKSKTPLSTTHIRNVTVALLGEKHLREIKRFYLLHKYL